MAEYSKDFTIKPPLSKYLRDNIGYIFRSIIGFSKRDLIFFVALLVVWTTLGVLNALNISIPFSNIVGYVTGTNHGSTTSLMNNLGGFFTKVIIASGLSKIIFEPKSLIKIWASFKLGKTIVTTVRKINFGIILIGLGVGFTLFGFLSYNSSFMNSFGATILGLGLLIDLDEPGFFGGLIEIVFDKIDFEAIGAKVVSIGASMSLLASTLLSLTGIRNLAYYLGGGFLLLGIILFFLLKNRGTN